jgi:hypothetical protein
MKNSVLITIISAVVFVNASVVWAEILPALTVSDTGYSVSGNDRTAGWEFTLIEDLQVCGLGVFDLEDVPMYAPGLMYSHEIGIWNLGELVYSTTIPAGTEGLLIDDFRYIETEPFWLTSGETYVIGATTIGEPFVGNSSEATITTLPSVIYERTLMSPSDSGFSLPTIERDYYYFGPNFLVIPEPTTLLLFGLGGLLLRSC